ncbi:hypothetical protein CRG98_018310 [Punica granatum]|uniref:Uncharacterized protein n=1 Tax=Punica granatum TaxID=22663 RepID=A0A2I0JYB0_PUNGR|nr:hypothetical protein CRG98_018310 [Punica granatum]
MEVRINVRYAKSAYGSISCHFHRTVHLWTVQSEIAMLDFELGTELVDDFVVQFLALSVMIVAETPYRAMTSRLIKRATAFAVTDARVIASIHLVK